MTAPLFMAVFYLISRLLPNRRKQRRGPMLRLAFPGVPAAAGIAGRRPAVPARDSAPPMAMVSCTPMPLANDAGQKAADGRGAHEGHGVDAHHPRPLVVADQVLDVGVGRGHLHHHAQPDEEQQRHGQPEGPRQRQRDQPQAEKHRAADHDLLNAAGGPPPGQGQGAEQRPAADRPHQESQAVRPAVQDLADEDRHQGHVGQPDQADPGDEGDDQAGGAQAEGIDEPFAQLGPEARAPFFLPGGSRMASRAKITAR